jgi:hypothetical protein
LSNYTNLPTSSLQEPRKPHSRNSLTGRGRLLIIPLRVMGDDTKEKKERAEEAEEKLREGLRRIFEATKELSKEVIEGFKEGYAGGKKKK